MKIYKRIMAYAAAALTMGLAYSCANTFEEITDMNLVRCLQPLNLDSKVSQGQNVTFLWDVAKDVETYTLEVYSDEEMTQLVLSEEVEAANVPVTKTLDVDKEFWFRVQAHSSKKDDSKWAVCTSKIKTFAVKSNLYMELAGRASGSISLTWLADPEVDRIEYLASGAAEPGVYTLTAEDIASGSATVPGLAPSTEYDLVLYYASANRGEVVAWTMPNPDGLTEVSTSAALIQGITDGASMLLKMEGSPYEIDLSKGQDISKGFKIYGEGGADGSRPVVYGCLSVVDAFDGGDIYIEGVKLDGKENKAGFMFQHKEGSTTEALALGSVEFRNCEISNYSKGLFYEWSKSMAIKSFTFNSCYIHDVNFDGTVGGDGFDCRQTSTFGTLAFVNNTITNGFRTFLRVDKATIESLVFENNTVSNLSFVENTNNGGLFGIQVAPGATSMKKNLFINFPEKSALISANTKYVSAGNLNLTASENYFYNVNDAFFNTNAAVADVAGKVLPADPCFNAKGGKYNIVGSSEIAGKQVGASKWWAEYVEAPEDLTMTTLEGAHTWDFSNGDYFSVDATKSMVRDQLLFGVTSNKITLTEGVFNFTSAATTDRKGVPTDGYLAFQVSQPGSVVIKPVDAAGLGNHFVIGVGSVNGTNISIKGGASALSDMTGTQKIVIKDITEESLVYIFPTGPISLAQLAWSTSTSDVNTALPAPVPTATPEIITAGAAEDVVITWEPVEDAGSYSIVFNGKTYEADETLEGEAPRFTIAAMTIGMLDPKSYAVEVYANPAKTDIYNTMSEAGVATFAVQPAGGEDGGSKAFKVKSIEELTAALGAKKEEIILLASGSPYQLAETLVLDYPVVLAGEGAETVVEGAVGFSGVIDGDITIKNMTFVDPSAAPKGVFLTIADGMSVKNLTVENVNLSGYAKSVIYGNFETATVESAVFKGITTSNWGTGQGVFDIRKGTIGSLQIIESTLVGGRDFIRMDDAVVCNEVKIAKNTIVNSNAGANGNGVLYVRSAVPNYKVASNLFMYAETPTSEKAYLAKTGVTVPSMSNNFFYNCGANFLTLGGILAETATANNGVVLETSPVADLANGDYTLTSALAISNRVGDPKWNPNTDGGSTTETFVVKDTTEFKAAIGAGKTDITLEAGEYVFPAKISAVKDLRLTGNGDVTLKGYIDLAGDDLGSIVIKNIDFVAEGAGTAINVSAASSMKNMLVKDCSFSGYSKSVLYDNNGLTANSVSFDNIVVKEHGTGQGVFDLRKSRLASLSIENSTIIGGRDLVRADESTISKSFSFRNNLVDGSNLGVNGNGIMYVRAAVEAYVFTNNLFINEVADGKSVILSKATGVSVPTLASNNYYYNVDSANFFNDLFSLESTAGTVLEASPVTDAAANNYTLVNADLMSKNVGPMVWNPNPNQAITPNAKK